MRLTAPGWVYIWLILFGLATLGTWFFESHERREVETANALCISTYPDAAPDAVIPDSRFDGVPLPRTGQEEPQAIRDRARGQIRANAAVQRDQCITRVRKADQPTLHMLMAVKYGLPTLLCLALFFVGRSLPEQEEEETGSTEKVPAPREKLPSLRGRHRLPDPSYIPAPTPPLPQPTDEAPNWPLPPGFEAVPRQCHYNPAAWVYPIYFLVLTTVIFGFTLYMIHAGDSSPAVNIITLMFVGLTVTSGLFTHRFFRRNRTHKYLLTHGIATPATIIAKRVWYPGKYSARTSEPIGAYLVYSYKDHHGVTHTFEPALLDAPNIGMPTALAREAERYATALYDPADPTRSVLYPPQAMQKLPS